MENPTSLSRNGVQNLPAMLSLRGRAIGEAKSTAIIAKREGKSRRVIFLPTPSFVRSPVPGGEADSFGLQVPLKAGLPRVGGLQPGVSGPPFDPAFLCGKRLDGPGTIFSPRDSSSIALPAGQSEWGKTGGGQKPRIIDRVTLKNVNCMA